MRSRPAALLKLSLCSGLFALGLLSVPTASPAAARAQMVDPVLAAEVGKAIFNDTRLSEPQGMACVSCHDPSAGFSYPNSNINQSLGPVPGAVPGRFGFRKPPSISYAAYLPPGIPYYDKAEQAYVGGLFYDGRAYNTAKQAQEPFVNPNEMNNLLHNVGDPAAVVQKIQSGPYADLFSQVYGQNVFQLPTELVYEYACQAIAAFEKSSTVAPFSSKYDAYLAGKVSLTDQELTGLRIVTGSLTGRPGGIPFKVNAHCSECHGIPTVYNPKGNPDLWTNSCYANLGAPRNPNNPYYTMTDPTADPAGYNPLGANFIDYGLGDFLYPLRGKPVADLAEGDPLAIDGTFKTPSLRNVDARPYPSFVKSYMHNGVFKSLEQVVHFYNTRNLTTYPGEVIDFTQPNPYANLKGTPLWPAPEWPSPRTMINPAGLPSDSEGSGMGGEQIGNMGLDAEEEADIVAFLKTLTDGYFDPNADARGTIRPR